MPSHRRRTTAYNRFVLGCFGSIP